MKKRMLLILCGFSLLALPILAQIKLLHEFAGGTADGKGPIDDLLLSGSTLYGMTHLGGNSNLGTIFKMQSDGSGFTLLHKFAGPPEDGQHPVGALILSGSTLFGMTNQGGKSHKGVIFKIQTDGSGYTVLHSFAGGVADGQHPNGSLILSGSTLFGVTTWGGSDDGGTIFKLETDGSGYALLHSFTYVPIDGINPMDSLILSGSTLYGMTVWGGTDIKGTIFKMQTDGSGYGLLHEFVGGAADGAKPYGSLILSGSTLYGMTNSGGDGLYGTIFQLQTDGSGYALLHEFAGGATDGKYPWGDLLLCDSNLFGMTFSGGKHDSGIIFRIGGNGASYTILHEFADNADDGEYPYGSFILSGSTLFGMTSQGGDSNGGVIFSLPRLDVTVSVLAERREIKAFRIMRQYGQIQFTVENIDIPPAYYCIKRCKSNGAFVLLRTIAPAELQNNRFQMQDKYLEKNIIYAYRVEAYNASDQLVGISAEKTI